MSRTAAPGYVCEVFPEASTLALKNAHPRDVRIRFEEGPHLYYIDGSCEQVVSMTKLMHGLFHPFDAIEAIRGIRRRIEAHLQSGKAFEELSAKNRRYALSSDEQIAAEWAAAGREASEAGTALHFAIECYLNLDWHAYDTVEFRLFRDFIYDHPWLRPYRTEMRVFCAELRVAGSIDMLFEDMRLPRGNFVLADWKRAKEIKTSGYCECPWERGQGKVHASDESCTGFGIAPASRHLPDCNLSHYSLQLNGYRWLLHRHYSMHISAMMLVVLHPQPEHQGKVKPGEPDYQTVDIPVLEHEIAEIVAQRRSDPAVRAFIARQGPDYAF